MRQEMTEKSSPNSSSPMLGVVAGLSGVFEDVQVGGSLAVRLEVGRSYKRSNHSCVAEDLQEEAEVDLGRKYFQYFISSWPSSPSCPPWSGGSCGTR